MKRFVLLTVALLASVAQAEPRLLTPEASAGVGVLGIGYTATDGRWGDLFIAPDLAGRVLFGGVVLDGDLLLAAPTANNGARFGGTLTARVGWSGERWDILVGPVLSYAPSTTPALQILPSVKGQVSFGNWGLSAGIFDQHGLAIAHLSADIGDYSIGYVAPFGGRAAATFHLGSQFALRTEGLLVWAFNTQVAYLAVSGVFEPGFGGGK